VIAVERLVDIAVGESKRVEHQVLADEPARIGDTVGELARLGVQHQARRADAVTGHDHHLGRLEVFPAFGVVVDRARGHAVGADHDLAHPGARPQFDAGADRRRPVGDVGAGLGALGTARRAVAQIYARRAAIVLHRGDGRIGRPPVPAELVQRPAEALAGLAERQRRHRWMV